MINEETLNKIHDLAVDVITNNFIQLKQELQGETIYGLGLGLVEDITGFFTVVNTIESLQEIFDEEEDEEEFDPWYIWGISEWSYDGKYHSKELQNTLNEVSKSCNSFDEEAENARQYADILIKALQTCDKNGLFGKDEERENIVVFIQYADASDEDFDNVSSERINPKSLHTKFLKRWDLDDEQSLSKEILAKI